MSGNYKDNEKAVLEASKNKATEEEIPKATEFDSSKLFKRMKAEWEALQHNPSSVDDKIKAQLEMLEQINNSAFDKETGEARKVEPSELGKMMQNMMKQQVTAADEQSVSAEYKSRGEAFMDP